MIYGRPGYFSIITRLCFDAFSITSTKKIDIFPDHKVIR